MRTAGILMPISSLPCNYGIGTMGKCAFEFIDFLKASGQSLWQILPIGPTGYGDSPYQSFSAFSGNPYFIDLDELCSSRLLYKNEIESINWGENQGSVDYNRLFENRFKVLRLATERIDTCSEEYRGFCHANGYWLEDYSLFMAIKVENNHVSWQCWQEELRMRDEAALGRARSRLKDEVDFWRSVQFLFYTQWQKMKKYANENGIKIIGDIPIYVSPDSSDLWANSRLFAVDNEKRCCEIAGCPPDAFSEDGQVWGNPLYNWEYHKQTDFAWWVSRLQHASYVFDITRIDHFRGFAGYYAIPSGDTTARGGHWCQGPGTAFIESIKRQLPGIEIIAEDLGFLTDDVVRLLEYSEFPGMKVLQFAFDSREESDYLPHNYNVNSVVYTGTHDNTTTDDWQLSAPAADVEFAKRYFDITPERSFTYAFIRAALGSVSRIAIIPMQDYLCLGASARINTPSTVGGNWVWRADKASFTKELSDNIRQLGKMYGRASS